MNTEEFSIAFFWGVKIYEDNSLWNLPYKELLYLQLDTIRTEIVSGGSLFQTGASAHEADVCPETYAGDVLLGGDQVLTNLGTSLGYVNLYSVFLAR